MLISIPMVAESGPSFDGVVTAATALSRYPLFEGFKIEFEAEGASFRDVLALKLVAVSVGKSMTLKLAGAEALRDINDCLDLRPDRIVAPMVESAFAVSKYLNATDRLSGHLQVKRGINVETIVCAQALDSILDECGTRLDFVTVGRSDLAGSMGFPPKHQNEGQILDEVEQIVATAKEYGLIVGLGGGITAASMPTLHERNLLRQVDFVETRRIVIRSDSRESSATDIASIVSDALHFEHLFLRFRKELNEILRSDDLARLTEIEMRLV